MSITKVNINTGLSGYSDSRIKECAIFKNIFNNKPTSQQASSLVLKNSSFELDDCSLVDSRLIHLSRLVELNTDLLTFRKNKLYCLFNTWSDPNGTTNKHFTVLTPEIAKQFFSSEWISHCQQSFSALLKENNNLLTSKFASAPISKVPYFK